jgi:carbon-monoxide dehydrogenase medium subunit
MLIEVHIPTVKGQCAFFKLGRRKAMTCSVVNTTVRLEMDGPICKQARIALGAMAPTPIRCNQAEKILTGKSVDKELIDKCAAAAIQASNPIDDGRATAWYRKHAGKNIVARLVAKAADLSESFQEEKRS